MNAPFKKKLTISCRPLHANQVEPYVMKLADELSDDPMIFALLGPNFKVIVDYNAEAKRITYSFRTPGDVGSDEHDAKVV